MKYIAGFFILVICASLVQPQSRRPAKTVAAPKVPNLKPVSPKALDLPKPLLTLDDLTIIIGTTKLYEYETIRKQIVRQSDGTIKIWVRQSPKRGKMPEVIVEIKADPAKNFDPTQYHHTMTLYRVKCRDRLMKSVMEVDYAAEGDVLRTLAADQGWGEVVPDSIGESILEAACARH